MIFRVFNHWYKDIYEKQKFKFASSIKKQQPTSKRRKETNEWKEWKRENPKNYRGGSEPNQ